MANTRQPREALFDEDTMIDADVAGTVDRRVRPRPDGGVDDTHGLDARLAHLEHRECGECGE